MAVEKSAVREGTRWDIRGRVVVVDEVTGRSVIFSDEHGCTSEVMPLDGFLARASDPVRAEHARLIKGLRHAQHDLPSEGETGKLLVLLRDTAVYLLERMPPTCPPYVEPVAPAPKVEPMAASTVAALTEAFAKPAVAEPIEDLVPDAPACAEVDEGPAEYRRIAREFVSSDDEPRSLKKRRF